MADPLGHWEAAKRRARKVREQERLNRRKSSAKANAARKAKRGG